VRRGACAKSASLNPSRIAKRLNGDANANGREGFDVFMRDDCRCDTAHRIIVPSWNCLKLHHCEPVIHD
jgi:hypothetical protein